MAVTREKIDAVLDRIEQGESERSACFNESINRATFRSAALKAGAADQYAKALEGLAAAQIEKLETTIEDMRAGTLDHQIGRIEVDARKWLASKFLPKRYGEKVDVTSDGKEIQAAVIQVIQPTHEEPTDNHLQT